MNPVVSWPEVALAAINAVQAIALAWLVPVVWKIRDVQKNGR